MQSKNSYTNEELMLQISNNNELAFAELYNRFWETLLAIAYNRLKNLPASEDIVHDVFISLWNNRNKIRVECLSSYLAVAVKYMVLNKIKRIKYLSEYQSQKLAMHTTESTTEDAVHYRRILNMVDNEINHLPEKCRLIFKYSRELGMTTKQIAESLNISPKTVDNQLHKALQHLKLKLKHFFFFLF